MKQTILMIVLTLMGTVGVYVVEPFWGVAIYYLFAVLRPQFIWEWSLPQGISWSFYVAMATIGAAVAQSLGILSRPAAEESSRPRLTAGHLCVFAFGAWVTLTYFTAQNQYVAYPCLIEYLKIFVMFAVASVLTRTLNQLWVLMVLTAGTLGYIAYEVNFLYVVHHYLGIQRNGYGGLDNNGAGLMLAMGVPLCWFIFQGSSKRWRWLFLMLIPVLVHAVLMTYSRGAMVSLLAVCPLLWLRSQRRLTLAFYGLLMGLVLVPTMAGPEIRARFLTIQQHEVDESANSRKGSWMAAVRIAAENPVFGVGIRNSPLISHQYGADFEGRVIHSNYLQIAADNGFPGLALLLLMLGLSWRGARNARRAIKGREDPEARKISAIASGIQCSLAVFCVGALFLSLEVFELPYLLIFLGVQLPVLAGPSEQQDNMLAFQGVPVAGRGPARSPREQSPSPTFRESPRILR